MFIVSFSDFDLPLCRSFTHSRTNWKARATTPFYPARGTVDTLGCTWNTTSAVPGNKRELCCIENSAFVYQPASIAIFVVIYIYYAWIYAKCTRTCNSRIFIRASVAIPLQRFASCLLRREFYFLLFFDRVLKLYRVTREIYEKVIARRSHEIGPRDKDYTDLEIGIGNPRTRSLRGLCNDFLPRKNKIRTFVIRVFRTTILLCDQKL